MSFASRWDCLTAMHRGMWRSMGPRRYLRYNRLLCAARLRALTLARLRYRYLGEGTLAATRTSDTAFVFGSGYSLNSIAADEWQRIAGADTIGLTGFVYQHWIKVKYHLIRGWGEGSNADYDWRASVGELAGLINDNPLFDDAVIVLQSEYPAHVGNALVGYGMLRSGRRIFPYHTLRGRGLPSHTFAEGLRHAPSTLVDAVNFAVCGGWKRIVLIGVDLYDTRYFWLKPDETLFTDYTTGLKTTSEVSDRGQRYDQPHSTIGNGIIDVMGEWRRDLEPRGISLEVYNPKSLMADVMPVFRWDVDSP